MQNMKNFIRLTVGIILTAWAMTCVAQNNKAFDARKGNTTGTNSYTVTIDAVTETKLYDNYNITVRFVNANTTASTLRLVGAVATFTATPINLNGSALVSGNIPAGAVYDLKYNATTVKWDLQKTGAATQWTTTGNDLYYNAGKVGIGTGTVVPACPLEVDGTIAYAPTSGTTTTALLRLDPPAAKAVLDMGVNAVGGWIYSVNSLDLATPEPLFLQPYTSDGAGVGIGTGTVSPSVSLEVHGGTTSTLKFVTGDQGANKVLTSDANGVANWQTNSASTLTLAQVLANGRTSDATGYINDQGSVKAITLNSGLNGRALWDASALPSVLWNDRVLGVGKWNYQQNYGVQFTARSLVDKGYVDSVKTTVTALQQNTRVSTQFDAAATTTLANITGLTANVVEAGVYRFEAKIHVTADAVGGHKYRMAGTATASSIIYQVNSINNGTNAFRLNTRITDLGTTSTGEAVGTGYYTEINGTIVVNAAGTITVQFAQNAANGTSSVLVNSTLVVTKIQ